MFNTNEVIDYAGEDIVRREAEKEKARTVKAETATPTKQEN